MKKTAIILGLVLAVLVFGACAEKGGTIVVKNEYTVLSVQTPVVVSVTKGIDLAGSDVVTLQYGESHTWNFDEDGTYTVSSLPSPTGFPKTVTLLGGNSETITVK